MASLTPQRSALGRFCRSPLGVRGLCDAPCSMIRRYDACTPPPPLDRCVGGTTHVWVCDQTPLTCPSGVRYGNNCFTPSSTVIPIEQLPPGDELILSPECSPGCIDPDRPCTECHLFYRAARCNGAPDTGDWYFPVELLPRGCVLLEDICYIASIGVGEVLPPGGQIYGGGLVYGGTCCRCRAGCLETYNENWFRCSDGTSVIPYVCCCSQTYRLTTDVAFSATVFYNRPGEGGDGSMVPGRVARDDWTLVGHAVRDFGPGLNPPAPVFRMTLVSRDYAGNVISSDTFDAISPNWHCAGVADFSYNPLSQDTFPLICPWENTGPNPVRTISIIAASLEASCTEMRAAGEWEITVPDQVGARIQYSINVHQVISNQGDCSGGCGQGGGNPVGPLGSTGLLVSGCNQCGVSGIDGATI